MRDQLLEERIRAIHGVATCTAGPEMVVIVASRGADAGELERKVQGNVDLEGRSLHVLGGVRMASGHRGTGGTVASDLGRVTLAAVTAAGLVGLLVGPSSARLLDNVVSPGSPLAAVDSLGAANGGAVSAVANRKPKAEPAPLNVAASRTGLAVEPAVRRLDAGRRPGRTAAARAGQLEQLRSFLVTEPVPSVGATPPAVVAEVAPVSLEKPPKTAKTRTGTSTVSTASTSASTVMFSIASASTEPAAKRPGKKAKSSPVQVAGKSTAEHPHKSAPKGR